VDCDELQSYRDMGCVGCTAAGGWYCENGNGLAACVSQDIAEAVPDVCTRSGGTALVSMCEDVELPTDTCIYQNDGECDAGTVLCAAESDFLDCSDCVQYRFEGCEACTAQPGCVWCALDAACVPTGFQLPSSFECVAADLVDTCPTTNDNFFPDPLFDAMEWIYNMINVKPVWEAGISKLLTFDCE